MGGWLRRMGWAAFLAALGGVPAHATFARVESMGKKAEFFMDDVSIFDNPANMNIFPNFLIGELGTYRLDAADTGASAPRRVNRDPENSWFGGIFSYSPARRKGKGNFHPQYSIGGAFNRLDAEILAYTPDSADGWVIPTPATNFDGFLGMTLGRGGMLGSHVYAAVQEGADLSSDPDPDSTSANVRFSALRGDLGVNWPLGKNVDGELSVGGARMAYGPDSIDAEWSFFVKARVFSTLELIHGELVPILNYSRIEVPGKSVRLFHFGLGANVSLDRGFFWLGAQGIWDEWNTRGIAPTADGKETYTSLAVNRADQARRGLAVSFGIERNIWWDWLVLRVGGRKEIAFTDGNSPAGNYSYIYTNPTGDMTSGDQVGFGVGVNVEEKLKVDATLAEDLPYTFGNLLSGPHHHVISRISATYSF